MKEAWVGVVNHDSPVGILGIARGLARDGVLEDLSAVDLFLHRPAGDQPIDDNVLGLPNAKDPIHRLGIRRWIPAGIV